MNARGDDALEREDDEWLVRADDMSLQELDALPFGAIVIESDGTIVEYNEYETRLSKLARSRVVGKNFFRDVAPCTAVQNFEGRLTSFLRTHDRVSETFNYRFAFTHGPLDVEVTFLRLSRKGRILIAIERTAAA